MLAVYKPALFMQFHPGKTSPTTILFRGMILSTDSYPSTQALLKTLPVPAEKR
jgi:hypothetical protein